MNNLDLFRQSFEDFKSKLARRGEDYDLNELAEQDRALRALQHETEVLLAQRNTLSRQIAKEDQNRDQIIERVQQLKETLTRKQESFKEQKAAFQKKWSQIPNIPEDPIPDGKTEVDNVVVRQVGDIPDFSFSPKDHVALGERLAGSHRWPALDFTRAARISGSRFVILHGQMVKLQRSLIDFMIANNVEQGFYETEPPVLVDARAMFHSGHLPKFGDDAFVTSDQRWLIPTAEVALTNYVADSILNEDELPLRWVAYTQCFRQEAGSAGKDTRGMIRQHQFSKVELVSVTRQEESQDELQRMLACAESILQKLNIPYRVVALCSGDLGFSAQETYDIEVWIPSQNQYREISSCSNCGDFQARRMQARYRKKGERQTRLCHTLNGSSLAVGRALVAILENYQQEDGTVRIPEVLQEAMQCRELIIES